jgi:hypothetical protein
MLEWQGIEFRIPKVKLHSCRIVTRMDEDGRTDELTRTRTIAARLSVT